MIIRIDLNWEFRSKCTIREWQVIVEFWTNYIKKYVSNAEVHVYSREDKS